MRYLKKFPASLFELKDIRSLAAVAMLLALRIVLGMFANATLPMFGPIPAGLVGALGDVLSFLIAPTGGAYFPGFTISGLLTGLIYGFALYNEKLSLPRIAIAWAVNALVVESFMAAYWLYILYAQEPSYLFYLSARGISLAVKCAPEILILFALGKPVKALSCNVIKKKA